MHKTLGKKFVFFIFFSRTEEIIRKNNTVGDSAQILKNTLECTAYLKKNRFDYPNRSVENIFLIKRKQYV